MAWLDKTSVPILALPTHTAIHRNLSLHHCHDMTGPSWNTCLCLLLGWSDKSSSNDSVVWDFAVHNNNCLEAPCTMSDPCGSAPIHWPWLCPGKCKSTLPNAPRSSDVAPGVRSHMRLHMELGQHPNNVISIHTFCFTIATLPTVCAGPDKSSCRNLIYMSAHEEVSNWSQH